LSIPVKYIGVGEKIDDLQVFDDDSFVRALFGGLRTEDEITVEEDEAQ
jgi:fused signal recognition particle receptor